MLNEFKKEKDYLRSAATRFSKRFPKIAGYLNFNAQESGDPVIENLLDSFAFLNSDIQSQLDSNHADISFPLLEQICPLLARPFPPVSHLLVHPSSDVISQEEQQVVKKASPLFAVTPKQELIRFRTAYDLPLLPLKIDHAEIKPSANYDFADKLHKVSHLLQLRFSSLADTEIHTDNLRQFRIHLAGSKELKVELYNLIFRHTVNIAILPKNSHSPVFLPNQCLSPVGFSTNESLLDKTPDSKNGYRLMLEYFVFPDKFFGFDLNLEKWEGRAESFDLLLFFNIPSNIRITAENFQTNKVPVVNLFRDAKGQELQKDHDRKKVGFELSASNKTSAESQLYSIEKIRWVSSHSGSKHSGMIPSFCQLHSPEDNTNQLFWNITRKESLKPGIRGSEAYLSLQHKDGRRFEKEEGKIKINAIYSNRDMGLSLEPETTAEFLDMGLIEEARLENTPTMEISPSISGHNLWKKISILSLNYMSLGNHQMSLDAFKSILRVFNIKSSLSNERQISAIKKIEVNQSLQQHQLHTFRGFRKCAEIHVELESESFVDQSLLLFGSLLSRFFPLYYSENAYTETVLFLAGTPSEWHRYPAIPGYRKNM